MMERGGWRRWWGSLIGWRGAGMERLRPPPREWLWRVLGVGGDCWVEVEVEG